MLGHLHSWYKSVERALWIDARQWLWTPQSGPLECTTSMSPNSSHGNRLQHDRKLSLHLMTIWEIISQVHFVFNWGDGMGQPMSVRHVDRNPCDIPPGKRLDDYTAGRRHKVDLKKKKMQSCRGGKKRTFIFPYVPLHVCTLSRVTAEGLWVLTGWATAAELVRLAQGRLEEESSSGWSQLLVCQL